MHLFSSCIISPSNSKAQNGQCLWIQSYWCLERAQLFPLEFPHHFLSIIRNAKNGCMLLVWSWAALNLVPNSGIRDLLFLLAQIFYIMLIKPFMALSDDWECSLLSNCPSWALVPYQLSELLRTADAQQLCP